MCMFVHINTAHTSDDISTVDFTFGGVRLPSATFYQALTTPIHQYIYIYTYTAATCS